MKHDDVMTGFDDGQMKISIQLRFILRVAFAVGCFHLVEMLRYAWYVTFTAYAVASFCATVFFFGGNVYDGLCGTVLGMIVYVFDQQSYRLKGLSEISAFGSTPCQALWRCQECLEPFNYFKCL